MFNILCALSVFTFLFGSSAFASSKVIVHSEESRWVVELIHTGLDGWPEVKSRQSFATITEADAQAKKIEMQNKSNSLNVNPLNPQMAAANLWTTKEVWSKEWERRYARWIEEEVDADFFARNKVATDCADVAYSLRWIFSRIHGLPAAAKLGGGDFLMSNETVRAEWAKLPTADEWNKDRRFLAALNYLLDLTYTHTLWADSFPVALNRESLLSGSYFLSLHDSSGHTQVIHWLPGNTGIPFLTLNSTVPRKVRSLMDSMLFADYPKEKEEALLRFRWPVKTSSGISLMKAVDMPDYSLEQFSFKSQKNFVIALYEKLGFTGNTDAIRDYLYKDLFELLRARQSLVEEGFSKCQTQDCKPGTAGWEDWGTPSRDSRIRGKIRTLDSVIFGTGKIVQDSNPSNANPYLNKEVINLEGTSWTLKALLWNWRNSHFSSDPREPITVRWGAGKESWVAAELKIFADKVQERIQFLTKARTICQKQDCSFGSAQWDAMSSNQIDKDIGEQTKYILDGSSRLPQDVLALLETHKNDSLGSVGGVPITLDHLFKNGYNFNSSALAPIEDQWALKTHLPLLKLSSPAMKPYFSKWILDESTYNLYDYQTGQEIKIGGKVLAAFKKAPVLLVQSTQLELFDLESGRRNILPGLFQAETSFATSNSGRLVTNTNNLNTQVWELSTETLTLKLLHSLPGSGWEMRFGDFLIQGSQLFDLMSLKLYQDFSVGDNYFILSDSFLGFEVNNKEVIFNRKLGIKTEFAKTSEGWSSAYLTPDGSTFVNMIARETHIYELNSQLQVVSDQTLKSGCWSSGVSSYFTCVNSERNKVSFYKLEKGQFNLALEGQGIMWVADHYYVTRLPNAQMQLFNRETHQLLLTAPIIIFIGDHYGAIKIKEDGYMHIVDLNDMHQALFTNVFPSDFGVGAFKVDKDLILSSYYNGGSSLVLWKRPSLMDVR
ncbi:MAG: hypothetical protein ACXVCY_14850 [Pseudobdellovibrionaceae bacterium]